MLSRITLFSSQKMMLLCFPMSSITMIFLRRSPISSRCSTSIRTIRSSPGWVTEMILPFAICFLKSMQKFGAVIGLGLLFDVK